MTEFFGINRKFSNKTEEINCNIREVEIFGVFL